MGKSDKWTVEEENLLREFYPTQGSNIPELLERHTLCSIKVKANRLGYNKKIRR